jgi:membrane-associated tyrosine/threonine-specific cdc2-inhibitory kinase
MDFPVPDFGSDADDFPVVPHSPSNLHSLTVQDLAALQTTHGLIVSADAPIRCTSNSTVYRAKTVYETHFALKVTKHKRRVREEYEKRGRLPSSSFLVETIRYFELSEKAFLQMELCRLEDIAEVRFDESDCWQLVFDIASALAVIHAAGWMHLDVSPANILRTELQFKLADFGTLTLIGDFAEGKEGAGPYVSPEALDFPRYPVDAQTDIFSFGLVLLEAIAGRRAPRGGCDGYQRIRRGEMRLGVEPYPAACSEDMMYLVNRMIATNPADRPTAAQLVEVATKRI